MSLKRIIPTALLGGILSSIGNRTEALRFRQQYEPEMKELGLLDAFNAWSKTPSLSNSNNLAKKLLFQNVQIKEEDVQIKEEDGENDIVYSIPEQTYNTSIGPNLPEPIKVTDKELKDNYERITISSNNVPDFFYLYNSFTKQLTPVYDAKVELSAQGDGTLAKIEGYLSKGNNTSDKVTYFEENLKNMIPYVPNPTPGGRRTRKRKSKHRKTKRR